jgi:hypothetical protein
MLYSVTPWIMAEARAEHSPAGWAEVGAVPLHARDYFFDVWNIRAAQPHHIRSTCLLHIRSSSVLSICARERTADDRNQNPDDGSRLSHELAIRFPDELCHHRPPDLYDFI